MIYYFPTTSIGNYIKNANSWIPHKTHIPKIYLIMI